VDEGRAPADVRLRARDWSLVALAVLPFLGLLALPLAPICALGWARWADDDPELDAAHARYLQGERLDDEGRYAEAAEHYRAYVEHTGSTDATALLGYTLHRAGRSAEGEALIDAAFARRPRAHYATYKAHVVVARGGADAALAWLANAALDPAARLEATADFHRQRNEHAAAIPLLRELLALHSGARFASADPLRLPDTIDDVTQGALASSMPVLPDLAECELKTAAFDDADRSAALGVAVGQVLHRDATYAGADYLAAGDVRCRVVRARVAIERAQWAEAEEHLRLARAMASWSGYSGWVRPVEAATAELAARRPPR
jgi:tetratricopeptide (TPR) repeat protein